MTHTLNYIFFERFLDFVSVSVFFSSNSRTETIKIFDDMYHCVFGVRYPVWLVILVTANEQALYLQQYLHILASHIELVNRNRCSSQHYAVNKIAFVFHPHNVIHMIMT